MIAEAPPRTAAAIIAPVDPRTRVLLMTMRQALLMAVAAIELYLGIAPKR